MLRLLSPPVWAQALMSPFSSLFVHRENECNSPHPAPALPRRMSGWTRSKCRLQAPSTPASVSLPVKWGLRPAWKVGCAEEGVLICRCFTRVLWSYFVLFFGFTMLSIILA